MEKKHICVLVLKMMLKSFFFLQGRSRQNTSDIDIETNPDEEVKQVSEAVFVTQLVTKH